mmetsp:Transcript_11344/g.21854  ORF Transcript_11344/g.21854 Transcript_11344/m.21854 type:complete len:89 (+) Transcript_11344:823-1089(+)
MQGLCRPLRLPMQTRSKQCTRQQQQIERLTNPILDCPLFSSLQQQEGGKGGVLSLSLLLLFLRQHLLGWRLLPFPRPPPDILHVPSLG